MALMGQHSRNPGGNPASIAAMQELAARGDPASIATLRRIAAGQVTSSNDVPGYEGKLIDWGAADTGHGNEGGRAAERAAAQALLDKNSQAFRGIAEKAQSSHKDWSGGALMKYAPAALGLIPGIGVPLAIGLGAGAGVAKRAANLEPGSELGGAIQGGAMAFGGTQLRGLGQKLIGGGTTGSAAAPATTSSFTSSGVVPANAPGTLQGASQIQQAVNTGLNSPVISAGYQPSFGATDFAMGSDVLAKEAGRSGLSKLVGGATNIAEDVGGHALRFGKTLTSKGSLPYIAQLAGAGASIYGANRMGAAEDASTAMQERMRQQEIDMAQEAQDYAQKPWQPFDEWKAERDRRARGG